MWVFRLRRTFRLAGRDALILFFAIRDPRTSRTLKLAAAAAIAWVVSPIDPLPDLPLIGWVDDLLVLSFGIPLLLGRLPEAVRRDAQSKADRFIAACSPRRKAQAARVHANSAKARKPRAKAAKPQANAPTANASTRRVKSPSLGPIMAPPGNRTSPRSAKGSV